MFLSFWLIFDVDSDGAVKTPIFKLFRIPRKKVWIEPLYPNLWLIICQWRNYFSYENLAMNTWTKMNLFNSGWCSMINSSKLTQIRINLSVSWKLSTISVLMIWNISRKLVNMSKAQARNDESDFSALSSDESVEPR